MQPIENRMYNFVMNQNEPWKKTTRDEGVCDEGVCDEGVCDEGVCDEGDEGVCDEGDEGVCDDKGVCG